MTAPPRTGSRHAPTSVSEGASAPEDAGALHVAGTSPCREPQDPGPDACRAGTGRPRDQRVSEAIAAAARRQLAQLGYARVTMDGIAAEAGVARATIYRRYRDKADLITSVVAADCADLPVGPDEDPRGELVHFLEEFDDRFSESCLEVIGCLLGSREEPQALELHRQRVIAPRAAYALRLLLAAQERGQLGPDADLDLALHMLVGAVFARGVSGVHAAPGWAKRAVETIFAGMGPERCPESGWRRAKGVARGRSGPGRRPLQGG